MPRRDHPFRHAPYRWLLAGVTINSFGNGITPVAIAFAVLDLGGSASQLGGVIAAYAAADVVAVLLGGVLGDRLPRQVMMQGSNGLAGIAQLVMAASLVGGWSSITLLAVLAAVNGCCGALGGPSSSAITQQTVPSSLLASAVTGRRIGQNAAMIAGNAVAGVLVVVFGAGWAIAVDAATFLVAAGCFSLLRVPALPAPDVSAGLVADVREGAREVLRHAWLWLLIGQAMLYHLFWGGALGVLGPIVVGGGISRQAWGYALSAMMVGFVVGGVVTVWFRPRRFLFVGTAFLSFTAFFPFAMAFSHSLALVLAGAFLHGFGLEIFSVGWDLSIQENIAPDKLARVYSFDQIGSFVARPVGLALTGPVAEAVGFRPWLGVVGVVMGGSSLLSLLLPDVRRLTRQQPERHELGAQLAG